jgi:Tat protein secretion system quality control protein TatD with DNase activity
MRGQPNVPANAVTVAHTIADLRGLDFDLMVQRTVANTLRAFPLVC